MYSILDSIMSITQYKLMINMLDMSKLQERLDIAITSAGISQSELARRVKLSRGAVSLWFVGSTKELKGHNLLAAAEALGVNPSWLDTGKGEMKPGIKDASSPLPGLPRETAEIIEIYETLTKDERKAMLAFLKALSPAQRRRAEAAALAYGEEKPKIKKRGK